MRHYFVVANQTLGGQHLEAVIQQAMEKGPSHFHVIVPATHPRKHLAWTEGEATALARERLDKALEWLKGLGAEATGEVGDERPAQAVEDALRENPCDEIVLSTLPPGASRWLKLDLPHVLAGYGRPVTHVIAATEASPEP